MKPLHVLALIGLAGTTALATTHEPTVFAPGVISTGEYEPHAAELSRQLNPPGNGLGDLYQTPA